MDEARNSILKFRAEFRMGLSCSMESAIVVGAMQMVFPTDPIDCASRFAGAFIFCRYRAAVIERSTVSEVYAIGAALYISVATFVEVLLKHMA